EAAVLLGHRQREESVLAEQLEVAPREQQLVVRALRVRAQLLLAELDQLRAQLLLAFRIHPVGIPLVAEPPEGLRSPRLVGHLVPPRGQVSVLAVPIPRARARDSRRPPCASRPSTARARAAGTSCASP